MPGPPPAGPVLARIALEIASCSRCTPAATRPFFGRSGRLLTEILANVLRSRWNGLVLDVVPLLHPAAALRSPAWLPGLLAAR